MQRRHFQGNHLLVPGFVFLWTVSIHGKDSRALLFNKPLTQDHWHQLTGEPTSPENSHVFPLLSKDTVSLATDSVWLSFFPLRKYKQEESHHMELGFETDFSASSS